jgi:cobalt-zinc-cadmium efflux system outer membrane protein
MKAEVKRAKASLAQAELTLQKEHSDLKISAANLSNMWKDQTSQNYSAAGNLYQFRSVLSFEELYQKVRNNPSIKQFAAQERLKQSEIELAQTNNQSNFNWSVGLTRTQATGDMGFKAGFSMDLFSESRNQGELQTAVAAKKEIFVSRQTALLRMHDQLFSAYQQRQQSVQVVERLRQDIIPTLELALKETQKAYQRGRYSYFEYVSARQELIVAKRQLIDAASAALKYGVSIEQLTAEPLTLFQKNS